MLTTVAAIALILGATETRSTIVMDFESLAAPTDGSVTSPYEEDGFSVAGVQLYRFGTANATNFLGSTGLEHDNQVDTVFSKIGGGIFDMISIDLGPIPQFTAGRSQDILMTGNLFGGGTVTTTFSVTGDPSFQKFLFPSSFSSLVSLTWKNLNPYHQFDNITVAGGSTEPAPEPATLALLSIGIAGIGYLRKKPK